MEYESVGTCERHPDTEFGELTMSHDERSSYLKTGLSTMGCPTCMTVNPIDDASDEDKLLYRYSRAGRNNGPAILIEEWWERTYTNNELRVVLPYVWDGVENPMRNLDPYLWVCMFKDAGFIGKRPTEPITVYRAQVGDDIGMSWTPDRTVAEWFHERNLGYQEASPVVIFDVRILEMVVHPSDLLAFIEGRDGIEAIVNPYTFEGRSLPTDVGADRPLTDGSNVERDER